MAQATVSGTLGFKKVNGKLQWCILPDGEWDDRFVGVQGVSATFEVPELSNLRVLQESFVSKRTGEAQQDFDYKRQRAIESAGLPDYPPLSGS